jgi:hypothetical protein
VRVVGETRFANRIAEKLGRAIDGACVARPRGAIWTTSGCAGAGAGLGAVVGGPIWAAVGGGLGAAVGLMLGAVLARRSEGRLASMMALVLTGEGFELHDLGTMGTTPKRLVVAAPYGDVDRVEVERGMVTLKAGIVRRSGPVLEIETSRFGDAAGGGEVLAALAERCGPSAAAAS